VEGAVIVFLVSMLVSTVVTVWVGKRLLLDEDWPALPAISVAMLAGIATGTTAGMVVGAVT
jgi:hypothetical protein